ncbi:TDP-N-acetylfucosamine:lipid II N-acetylfucosaminyltransferase [Halosquirtibacter xylanolyticus]|uniref:TDP-N-acetylfucosamine:lipid II N-acetylfucosaminyltransferase n=1 Tax=Halosquirtibacter xylanolyticus TaxID=3374599 RepID=UPI0037498DA2|nr:TDP-N-acetylfucosamine:lipid II N-acetylfucosaminyltransferase [Prolixibacteraceae bacterium]
MDKKILHIAMDDKFINASQWVFDKAFPSQNDLIICIKEEKEVINHIYPEYVMNFVLFNKLNQHLTSIIENYHWVVLHSLSFEFSQIVLNFTKATFIWSYFGYEVYRNTVMSIHESYGKKTEELITSSYKMKIREFIRKQYYRLHYGINSPDQGVLEASKHISYFATPIREEYEMLIEKGILSKSCQWINFSYYPMEFIFDKQIDMLVCGNNILLGNSAFHSNNHIEAIEMIKSLSLQKNQKIITPLSYGDTQYAKTIETIGIQKLSGHFEPLNDFMALDQYNKTLQSCGFVVMNHYRQQALGNILASLWMGAKVFLDNRNNIYKYLKRIGVKVFLIHQLKKETIQWERLPIEDVRSNREVLIKHLSKDVIIHSLQHHWNQSILK